MPNRLDLFGFRERASDDSAHGSFLGIGRVRILCFPVLSVPKNSVILQSIRYANDSRNRQRRKEPYPYADNLN
jgi:hypothetical protein